MFVSRLYLKNLIRYYSCGSCLSKTVLFICAQMRHQHIHKHIEREALKKMKIHGKSIRFALPFAIKCLECSGVMPKFTRLNSIRKERGHCSGVELYRFFFRCKGCRSFLSVDTDPENKGYAAGTSCEEIDVNLKHADTGALHNNMSDKAGTLHNNMSDRTGTLYSNMSDEEAQCRDPFAYFIEKLKGLLGKESNTEKLRVECDHLLEADLTTIIKRLESEG